MSPTDCPHTADHEEWLYAARDYISGESFDVRRCRACGLVRIPPPPSDHLARYYPPGYYGQGRRYNRLLERCLDQLYAHRARMIEAASGGVPGRALDVGCGRGLLLHHLRSRGWQVMGTELSDESAHYARTVLHLDVKTGDIAELDMPDGSFDTVILWHVLEHIANPATLLAHIARLLRPGGTILVAVPNFASYESRWAKARWFHLDVPRHVTHFSLPVLTLMLRSAGLSPFSTRYFAVEYDVFSFVQTALNMLGLRHNALYNLLRTRGAKVLTGKQQAPVRLLDIALCLYLTPLLGAVSLVWIPIVTLLGRAATVTVYARKLHGPSEAAAGTREAR